MKNSEGAAKGLRLLISFLIFHSFFLSVFLSSVFSVPLWFVSYDLRAAKSLLRLSLASPKSIMHLGS